MSDDLDQWLGQGSLPERTVPICLRGDLIADVEELDRQFAALPEASGMLNGHPERRRIAEQAEALREQMRASTKVFRLRARTPRRWDELTKEHPPLPDNDDHKQLGYNSDTFFDALVRESVVEPVFSAEQWERFEATVNPLQWQQLVAVAQGLNIRSVDVPFSFAASSLTRSSEPE